MIIAVGTDIIAVARIRAALENPNTGEQFRARVFTAGEIEYCLQRRRHAESFAARFAAKEAIMKALGKGFGEGIGWREIEVTRDTGRPLVVLCGNALQRANELGITHWHLSLSHSEEQAIAFVVAEAVVIK